MNYQNLAYCRILHIWFFFYLCKICYFSPLVSLFIIFPVHLLNISNNFMTNSKKYGLVISDMSLILIDIITKILRNDWSLYLYENILIFILYNLFLLIYNYVMNDNINIINLHMNKLKDDDIIHNDENYYEYIVRVWTIFLYL